jgi:DsbC/DsbD-like thiol-disulfide interchange protein
MLQRNLFLVISLTISVLFSACSQTASAPSATSTKKPTESPAITGRVSSVDFVKAAAAEVQIPAGESAEAVVRVTIQKGYHINANPATDSYLRATELALQPGDGVSVGFITYPSPITKKFSFSQKPLAVYESEAAIKVMLKAAGSAPKGLHSFAAKLSVQACDDQVCYAPGTIDLSVPVTVK